jgi:hypothetical protein
MFWQERLAHVQPVIRLEVELITRKSDERLFKSVLLIAVIRMQCLAL